MKLKQLLKESYDFVKQIIIVLIKVGSIFGFIWLVYFLGIKGILGIVIGMTTVLILMMTKNPLLMWIMTSTNSKEYSEVILHGEEKARENIEKETNNNKTRI